MNILLMSGRDVDELKEVILNPKEDCFSRVIVNCGGLRQVPIQELFLTVTRYLI